MKRVNHWLGCDTLGCWDEFGPAPSEETLVDEARRIGWGADPDRCPACQQKVAAALAEAPSGQ